MTRVAINRQVASVDGNARVVIASGAELVAAPAKAIAALATAEGVSAPVRTAPDATAGQAIVYVDSVDGDLKVRFPNGTIATLASN